jgi:hypothetical protein
MFATKLNGSLVLELSVADALAVCHRAVADLGWRVLDHGPTHVHCEEVAAAGASFNGPVEVDIILSGTDRSRTSVLLNGAVFGLGPIEKGHLQAQAANLRDRIELVARDQSSDAPANASDGLSSELE